MNYKEKKWFSGVRRNVNLVGFSLSMYGQRKYLEKLYDTKPVTALLVPNNGEIFRKFCLEETKVFNSISLRNLEENPKIILSFVDLDYANFKEVYCLVNLMKSSIKENDFQSASVLLKFIGQKMELHGAYFRILVSLGMMMMDLNPDKFKEELRLHDEWRNSLIEDDVEKAIQSYIEFIFNDLNSEDILKYLTFYELIQNLNNPGNVREIIETRKKGFIFYSGEDFFGVKDKEDFVREMEKYFSELDKIEFSDEFVGRVTYASDEVINGEVVLVKSKEELKGNYEGKILVAIQTTPHFVPYLNGVKAIITDEGGVTSHAAIISREFKIPAVVGTQIATKVLKNGDIVEITFKDGKVKKIK